MKTYRLTKQAESSLEAIAAYTQEKWGIAQRDKYLDVLAASLEKLVAMPTKGRKRDELCEGLRSYPVAKHVVYYLMQDDTVLIADILHENMDPTSHMNPKT